MIMIEEKVEDSFEYIGIENDFLKRLLLLQLLRLKK